MCPLCFSSTTYFHLHNLFSNITQVATFNVAGKRPPPGLRLDEWLGGGPAAGGTKFSWPTGTTAGEEAKDPAATGGSSTGPDMLAVGFVELVPLNAGNVMGGEALRDKEEISCAVVWWRRLTRIGQGSAVERVFGI